MSAVEQVWLITLAEADRSEREMAAIGVVAREAAALALGRLDESHFRDPRCWRVLNAAAKRYANGGGTELDEDIDAIAEAAAVPASELRAWVRQRGAVYADFAGTVARQIRDAARRRARTLKLLAELETLGVAEPIEAPTDRGVVLRSVDDLASAA